MLVTIGRQASSVHWWTKNIFRWTTGVHVNGGSEKVRGKICFFLSSVFLSATKMLDQWLSSKTIMEIAEDADPLLWHEVMVLILRLHSRLDNATKFLLLSNCNTVLLYFITV